MSKNKIAKVLNLYADRPERRPVGAVMLARVPLFPPVRKKTITTMKHWNKEYAYDPNSQDVKTIVKVENPRALTHIHKRVFDSIIIAALKVYRNNDDTLVLINPYELKKMAGIKITTDNSYLLQILEELQDLKVTIIYKLYDEEIEKQRIIPISLVSVTVGNKNKKAVNNKDKRVLFKIRLTPEFVDFLNTKIVYNISPDVLKMFHNKIKNPYIDYAFKYLITQSRPQNFELFTLLQVIFRENINSSARKKIKKDIQAYATDTDGLLKQLGIAIYKKDGKIYLSYTPKHAPAVTLFFPPRSKQSD